MLFRDPPDAADDEEWSGPLAKQPYAEIYASERRIYINPRKKPPRKGWTWQEELADTIAHEFLHMFNGQARGPRGGKPLTHRAVYKLSTPFGRFLLENHLFLPRITRRQRAAS